MSQINDVQLNEEFDDYLKDVFIPFARKTLDKIKTADVDLSRVGPIGLVRIAVVFSAEDLYLSENLQRVYHQLKNLGL